MTLSNKGTTKCHW